MKKKKLVLEKWCIRFVYLLAHNKATFLGKIVRVGAMCVQLIV